MVSWYLYDGLGSVLGEVDTNGNIASSRKYDVYGVVRGGSNSGGTSSQKFVGALAHTSEDNTGLIYMRARYMDPALGRFTSQDMGKQGSNWLVYCNNNPVCNIDKNGKEWSIVGVMFSLSQAILGAEGQYDKTVTAFYIRVQLAMAEAEFFITGTGILVLRAVEEANVRVLFTAMEEGPGAMLPQSLGGINALLAHEILEEVIEKVYLEKGW